MVLCFILDFQRLVCFFLESHAKPSLPGHETRIFHFMLQLGLLGLLKSFHSMFGLSVSLVVLLCFVRESQDLSTRIEAKVDSQDGLWFFGLKLFSTFVLFCCACSLELYRLESSIFPGAGTYSNHCFGLHRTSSNFLGICRSWWGGSEKSWGQMCPVDSIGLA